jgi:hypothetical protein
MPLHVVTQVPFTCPTWAACGARCDRAADKSRLWSLSDSNSAHLFTSRTAVPIWRATETVKIPLTSLKVRNSFIPGCGLIRFNDALSHDSGRPLNIVVENVTELRTYIIKRNLSQWPTWCTNFNTFITILYMYMFRAISCSSSGGQIVLIQLLVSSLSVSDRPVHSCAVYRTVCRCRLVSRLSLDTSRQRHIWIIPEAVNAVKMLLMMSENIARNM